MRTTEVDASLRGEESVQMDITGIKGSSDAGSQIGSITAEIY